MFNTTRTLTLAILLAIVQTWAATTTLAQTTESLAVDSIAPEGPPWMADIAKADDFREPTSSTAIESLPYDAADLSISTAQTTPLPVGHQPAGALSGKIMFAMAGHGWTYDYDEMYYYTQRGLSHGMVEDLGNADQMHIYAHLIFNAGATVVPLRPIDHQPNERIIDNTMPQVQFYGNWRSGTSDRFFGEADDTTPYAISDASLLESAIARYQPYIPESGYYPVYVWARDGLDRSNQLYRIKHAGGATEVRVNWRQIGKAWVWLGTYYFDEGDTGYVDVSNQVIDPYEAYHNHVVVADAVRFGNGRGDVPRPGGISGFNREDEGDCYWIQRSLGVAADRRIYDSGTNNDGNSTVSSPPKAAAHINRESYGSYLDRLLISFHSNASTGKARGAIALYNAKPTQRPSYQELLAEIIGDQINAQMTAEKPPANDQWSDRERNTYSGINFGELRRDYIQNEMAATIAEVAFHDNAEDALFMLDPRSRIEMAQATLQGILQWYSQIQYPKDAATMPPAAPSAIAATVLDGQIQVKWKPGATARFDGGPAVTFRVYRSADGYGFDGGIATEQDAQSLAVDPLTTSGATFLRVTALNGAGESFPSQTIAVAPAHSDNGKNTQAKTLFLAANTILDHTTNIPYNLGVQPGGGPYKLNAETERVRPVYTMQEPAGAAEAIALAANGIGFDGADTAAYTAGLIETKPYTRIALATGQQNPDTPLLSGEIFSHLDRFANSDGKLIITGSGFAENLLKSGKSGRNFLEDVCGITSATASLPAPVATSLDDRFLSESLPIKLVGQNRQWAATKIIQPAELHIKKGRSLGLMKYNSYGSKHFAAALTRPGYSEGEVLVLGFPLALVKDTNQQTQLMAAILKQL